MNIQLTAKINGGTQGEVWATEDGRVVKFTTSKAEVITSDRLRFVQQQGVRLPHFPKIAAVSRTDKGFAILREDVPDIQMSKTLKDDLYVFQTGWSYEDERRLGDTMKRSPQLRALHADLQNFFELTKIRICDLDHEGNIGGLSEHLVIRDLGLAVGVDYDLFEQIVWSQLTFNAPAPDEISFSL